MQIWEQERGRGPKDIYAFLIPQKEIPEIQIMPIFPSATPLRIIYLRTVEIDDPLQPDVRQFFSLQVHIWVPMYLIYRTHFHSKY